MTGWGKEQFLRFLRVLGIGSTTLLLGLFAVGFSGDVAWGSPSTATGSPGTAAPPSTTQISPNSQGNGTTPTPPTTAGAPPTTTGSGSSATAGSKKPTGYTSPLDKTTTTTPPRGGTPSAALTKTTSSQAGSVRSSGSVHIAANPSPPFAQCPPVGSDTGCEILIVLNPGGTATILQDTSQGPYDGSEDTLIGVQNNSGTTVSSFTLTDTSGTNIFGFDGDGPCTGGSSSFSPTPPASQCTPAQTAGTDPQDYEGPDNTFSNISADGTTGTINFTTPLAPGASTYFALEEKPNATSLSVVAGSVKAASASAKPKAAEAVAVTKLTPSVAAMIAHPAPVTATPPHALAVTGINATRLLLAGLLLAANGGILVGVTRRWQAMSACQSWRARRRR